MHRVGFSHFKLERLSLLGANSGSGQPTRAAIRATLQGLE
jgi:hypothetical protein